MNPFSSENYLFCTLKLISCPLIHDLSPCLRPFSVLRPLVFLRPSPGLETLLCFWDLSLFLRPFSVFETFLCFWNLSVFLDLSLYLRPFRNSSGTRWCSYAFKTREYALIKVALYIYGKIDLQKEWWFWFDLNSIISKYDAEHQRMTNNIFQPSNTNKLIYLPVNITIDRWINQSVAWLIK